MPETYEGKPCKYCERTTRYRSNRHCVQCVKDAWTKSHDEHRNDPIYRYLEQLVNRRRRALNRIAQREARRITNG